MSRVRRPASGGADRLLALVRAPDYEPVRPRALIRRLQLAPAERRAMRRVIQRLLREGSVVRGAGGTIRAARAGEDDARDRTRSVLGIYTRGDGGGTLLPYDPREREPLHVPGAFAHGATEGQVVRAEVLRGAGRDAAAVARVLELLGPFDAPGMDVRLVAGKYALRGEFPPDVLAAAERLPARVGASRSAARETALGPPPVTIDPEDARDFDDAIAVAERPRGGFRLFVHIADVAHYVRPGDPIDEEARRRATSVYFPDRVVPMLPERLSSDLCSLRPGVVRRVQSVVLDFAADGQRSGVRFADGCIRSAARLSYDQAARAVAGERPRGMPAGVAVMLRRAERLRALLERRRQERGSIDLDLPAAKIRLDEFGIVQAVSVESRGPAHRMVEEFMLAANEAVAEHLENAGLPCLFRVHERPDPLKIAVLAELVESLGVPWVPPREDAEPRDLQRLLDAAAGRDAARVVASAVLRAMKQARYGSLNVGHFGLAAPTYCHFTSPIRRYPDLVVHRLLRAARAGGRPDAAATADVAFLGPHCSELERSAEAAERELAEGKKLAWIARHVGEERSGIVSAVVPFGVFVEIEEHLVEGLLRAERLGDEYFAHDARRQLLRGTRSGTVVRLGDRLRVRIARVDRLWRRIDLVRVGDTAGDRAGTRPARTRAARRARPGGQSAPRRRRSRSAGDRDGGICARARSER